MLRKSDTSSSMTHEKMTEIREIALPLVVVMVWKLVTNYCEHDNNCTLFILTVETSYPDDAWIQRSGRFGTNQLPSSNNLWC